MNRARDPGPIPAVRLPPYRLRVPDTRLTHPMPPPPTRHTPGPTLEAGVRAEAVSDTSSS